MKTHFFIILLLLGLVWGCGKEDWKNAVLVRDCTGSYIRLEDKEFLICNQKKVSFIETGTKIEVVISQVSECTQEGIVCMMLHEHDGFVKVERVRYQ